MNGIKRWWGASIHSLILHSHIFGESSWQVAHFSGRLLLIRVWQVLEEAFFWLRLGTWVWSWHLGFCSLAFVLALYHCLLNLYRRSCWVFFPMRVSQDKLGVSCLLLIALGLAGKFRIRVSRKPENQKTRKPETRNQNQNSAGRNFQRGRWAVLLERFEFREQIWIRPAQPYLLKP